ncbi:MAG: TIGR03936 family radical SAM-associated protein [Candidatus Omnitrophica bacterium]|nr:TIGR03936 family radical SAM-associated protein [Candidatus Omnitrophota bacterium]
MRIIYEKKGPSRFISNNYIGRIFERCLRRISLPFEFSQGFNKRVKMSLGPPLAVGIEGNNEIIDVHVKNENIPDKLIKESLNQILPEGLRIVECRYLTSKEKSPPKVNIACYVIRIASNYDLAAIPDYWRVVYKGNDSLKIEVNTDRLSHKQLFSVFGTHNVIERFLIF